MADAITLPPLEVEADPLPPIDKTGGTGSGPGGELPNREVPLRRPGPKEIATLTVRGRDYTDWTSVRVEIRELDWYPVFQFECTEESPMPVRVADLQFVPGDIVKVLLGGVPAILGYITERHVGYNATSHGVRLVGVGKTADIANSSVPVDKLGNHDNKPWIALTRDIINHLGIQVETKGIINSDPYENIQIMPGDKLSDVIERYAKPRNIMIGSRSNGNLLAIGEHPARPVGHLEEGVGILRANCVFRDMGTFKQIDVVSQNFSGDGASGDSQNQQRATRQGSNSRNKHLVVSMELADKQQGTEWRADIEQAFTEGTYVEAQITVQGWFKDQNQSDEIWRAGEYYTVKSPSLILSGQTLGCKSCVYEQSNAGTTTTMTLVRPIDLHGRASAFSEDNLFANQEKRAQAGGASAAGVGGRVTE